MAAFEDIVLKNIMYNSEYNSKVLPYLTESYFQDDVHKIILRNINRYQANYNNIPTKEALFIVVDNHENLTEDTYKDVAEKLNQYYEEQNSLEDISWLIDETESWARNRALYNAVLETIPLVDNNSYEQSTKNLSQHAIPELFQEALSVNFEESLGHSYFENAEERYDYFHEKREKLPFHVELLNKITKGGLENRTINCIIGETGKGKTIIGTSLAAHYISEGKNGVYFTMEMDEPWINKRVDADLLNLTVDDLDDIPKKLYTDKVLDLKRQTSGDLITKQYPTGAAHAGHFRYFLKELKLKKGFEPDFIIVDYLNICASQRIKLGKGVNTNTLLKNISEELRGLAIEFDVPLITFVQYNRDGMGSSDVDMTDTAESIGITNTFDLYLAMISTEELENAGKIMFKQLKNRYGPIDNPRYFTVGMDKPKMRIYDVDTTTETQEGPNEEQEETKFTRESAGSKEKELNLSPLKV